jgi:hypothetical protein
MRRLWIISFALLAFGGAALNAQSAALEPPSSHAAAVLQDPKVMREFRGVKLGLKTEAVRAALGKPESTGDDWEEYKISDNDTITVRYDAGTVKAIQVQFTNAKNAPAWTDVVGKADIQQLDSGAKTARVTLNEEKFWVSMYQNKDATVIRITISR